MIFLYPPLDVVESLLQVSELTRKCIRGCNDAGNPLPVVRNGVVQDRVEDAVDFVILNVQTEDGPLDGAQVGLDQPQEVVVPFNFGVQDQVEGVRAGERAVFVQVGRGELLRQLVEVLVDGKLDFLDVFVHAGLVVDFERADVLDEAVGLLDLH